MYATDNSTKAPVIVRRQRVLHAVMAHCPLSEVIYLLVSPLGFVFVPVFVLCVFADWCCDNYK